MLQGKGQGHVFTLNEHKLWKIHGAHTAVSLRCKQARRQVLDIQQLTTCNDYWDAFRPSRIGSLIWHLCVIMHGMLLLNTFIDLFLEIWFPHFCGTQKEKTKLLN